MKARFMVEEPGEIIATMKITMPIKEWIELRDQLANSWPSSDLSRNITDLVVQARKVFYASEESV